MKFRNQMSGEVVDATHVAEGTAVNGERAELGDWKVTDAKGAEALLKPEAFFTTYQYVSA